MATLNAHDVGDLVRITGNLATAGGAAVDPGALVVVVLAPNGTRTTYTYGSDAFPVRTEAGAYYVDYTPTQAGEHYYKFASTGVGQAVDEGAFIVTPPRIS